MPCSLVSTGREGLSHFVVEAGPANLDTDITALQSQLRDIEALDGNCQLFMVMQDLAMGAMTSKLDSTMTTAEVIMLLLSSIYYRTYNR